MQFKTLPEIPQIRVIPQSKSEPVMQKQTKEGILLINKPPGMTSHDVVDCVRAKFCMRRVGHAGTLDPLAEGLLIILVGKATKLFPKFVAFDKEYIGILKMGEVTSTGDSQGDIVGQGPYQQLTQEEIASAFAQFTGEIEQIPPMVSAVRVGGKRLYRLARKGIEVERKARQITIHALDIIDCKPPLIEFYTRCSKGTYIRKLAEDIGDCLGCGAHMIKIKRVSIGPFKLADAASLDDIDESLLREGTF